MKTHAHHITPERAAELNGCGRYLAVTVYRAVDFPDCTLNGVTARFSRLYVPLPDGHIRLADVEARGEQAQILDVIPSAFSACGPRFKPRGETRWCMAGGNLVDHCDSRYCETYGGPVSVHDRIESAAMLAERATWD